MKNFEDSGGLEPEADQRFLDEWHDFLSELTDNDLYKAKMALERARTSAEAITDEKIREEALEQVKEGEQQLSEREAS